MPPLALTADQLATVFNAAEPLPPSDRSRFLQDVATALAAIPEIGDGSIARTCREIQQRYFRPPADLPRPPVQLRKIGRR